MAERNTKVTLTAAVGQYVAGMQKAEEATRSTTNEAKRLSTQKQDFDALGRGMVAFGALTAAGIGVAVAKFADFDKQMSSVQAATHESTENMHAFRNAALEAGADTAFTASEAAKGIEELAKAGVSTRDVLGGGLKGALDLAAAGEIAVGDAAETAASAMTQFGLAGSDVPHIADLLAAAAGKAQGGVSDMAAALNQSGLVASQMGLSLEETTGALASFASAGLVGSDAGTSFRAMLLRLANPTDEAKQRMAELGIAAYDAGGQFVGIESLAGQLEDRLGGLTQAQRNQTLALLFGQDAIRSASILYEQGAAGIADWTDKVNDAGYAAETAEMRMDNLAGDVEKLGGSLDTALIKTGSAANDALRGLVQGAESVVDGFANAPAGVQATTLAVAGVATAASLAGGAFILAVPKVAAFKAAVATMTPGAQRAVGVLGGIAKAGGLIAGMGVAVSILDKLTKAGNDAAIGLEKVFEAARQGDVDKAFENVSGSVNDLASSLELLEGSSFDSVMERFGEAIGGPLGVTGQVTEARTAFQTLGESLARMVQEGRGEEAAALFDRIRDRAEQQGISVEKVNELMPAYGEALSGASNEQDRAAGAAGAAAEGIDAVGSTADAAGEKVQSFADQMRNLGNTHISLEQAQSRVQQALDEFDAALGENGATLDLNEEAGRANLAAIHEIAQAYKEEAAATVEATGNQADAIPVIEAGRQAVINARMALGESAEAAGSYADRLGLIPGNVQTQVDLRGTEEAFRKADEMARKIREIPNSKTVYLYIQEQKQAAGAAPGVTFAGANGMIHAYAGGGFSTGIYKGRPGSIHKFAEPETRWEAYISGKPGQEDRNIGIALEALNRLGYHGGGAQAVTNVVNNNFNVSQTPIRDNDPLTTATVMGREFARRAAG
jgi:TP901 family phage tail tape measure protein